MHVKGPNPADTLPPPGDAVLSSFLQAMHLKRLYRQGWLKRGVPPADCESVADHTFGVALLAILAPLPATVGPDPADPKAAGSVPTSAITPASRPDAVPGSDPASVSAPAAARPFDRGRAVLLALAHELGEVYAGDITPVDGVSPEEKTRLERASMERVVAGLDPATAETIRGLWEEFETLATPEARFVKELDRLEMGIQAAVYKAEGRPRMDEFLQSADRAVRAPELRAVLRSAEQAASIEP